MIKNETISEKRLEILIKSFIETEMLTFKRKGYGYMKKYFRYSHLGNRLFNKIKAVKSGVFILLSKEADVKITIVKGDIMNVASETTVEIKNNELCFKQN